MVAFFLGFEPTGEACAANIGVRIAFGSAEVVKFNSNLFPPAVLLARYITLAGFVPSEKDGESLIAQVYP